MSNAVPFGELLRRKRIAAGLSQEALAERARLSTDAIAALERGRRSKPRPATLALLADALGLAGSERANLIAAGAPGTALAPPRTTATAPLPMPLTALIGRERERADVMRLLRTDGRVASARLVTLIGPGGVGKTRLALAVAAALQGDFADGATFVDLSALRDAGLVGPTIAQALGLREAGEQGMPPLLESDLRDQHLLLVLDNFEHVAPAAPLVATLVARCPALVVLVTSRTPLRLRGEQQYQVSPLPLPAAQAPVAEVSESPAIRLFVVRAREVLPDFAPDGAGVAAMAEICRRLDGLPLAIELAAARVRLLPPAALAARLERRLNLLTHGSRDLPARQQTLRAAIAWSYDLLAPQEQGLFRHMAVFAGGCSLEAAEAICGLPAQSPDSIAAVLDGLAALTDQALLRAERPAEGKGEASSPRFRMLETIREFARERLDESGEAEELSDRHARYFVALAREADLALSGQVQSDWLDRLEREHDNLRAALDWLRRRDPTTGLRLAGWLGPFWRVRGHHAEGRRWLDVLLAGRPCEPSEGRSCERERARALREAGVLAADQSDDGRAEALLEEGLALYRALGDRAGEGAVLQWQGWLAVRRGDFERAEAALQESLGLFRALEDRRETGSVLRRLGGLAAEMGDYERAARCYEESQTLFEQLGDRHAVGWLLNQQGRLAQDRGDYGRAWALLERALAHDRELRDTLSIGWDLCALGNLARVQSEYVRARELLAESLVVLEEVDDRIGQGSVVQHLGHLAAAQGDHRQARSHYTASLARYRALGADALIGVAAGDLANLARQSGDTPAARAGWLEALTILRRFPKNRWALGWALANVGTLLAQEGDHVGAVRLIAAAAASHAVFWTSIDPDERADCEEALVAGGTALGDAFAAAWAEGQALTTDAAVALALERLA